MLVLLQIFTFSILSFTHAQFASCYDHAGGGKEPHGAARFYQLLNGGKKIAPAEKYLGVLSPTAVFKLIIEDVQFTSYKCWDQNKNLTGFDIEMMSSVVWEAGYSYIEFVPRVWNNVNYLGKDQVSLLVDLVDGLGDAVSAGMSINDDRREIVHMIGPIYKAGKKLMARKDNKKVQVVKNRLLKMPDSGYQALSGLSILVQESTIRAEYFKKLSQIEHHLIEFVQPINKSIVRDFSKDKLTVVEAPAEVIEEFTSQKMNSKVYGKMFDLLMIDTGSTESLIQSGFLNDQTEIVSGNLGADKKIGSAFGLGDGVSMRKNDSRINLFSEILARDIRSGRIGLLVEKWFKDENAADHSWAE